MCMIYKQCNYSIWLLLYDFEFENVEIKQTWNLKLETLAKRSTPFLQELMYMGLSINKGGSGKYNFFWTFKENCHLTATFPEMFVLISYCPYPNLP